MNTEKSTFVKGRVTTANAIRLLELFVTLARGIVQFSDRLTQYQSGLAQLKNEGEPRKSARRVLLEEFQEAELLAARKRLAELQVELLVLGATFHEGDDHMEDRIELETVTAESRPAVFIYECKVLPESTGRSKSIFNDGQGRPTIVMEPPALTDDELRLDEELFTIELTLVGWRLKGESRLQCRALTGVDLPQLTQGVQSRDRKNDGKGCTGRGYPGEFSQLGGFDFGGGF